MPYPNFHACRLKDPGTFEKLRYKRQDGADVVVGQAKGGENWTVQAIRFPKETWDEAKARSSCSARGGTFEAAKVSEMSSEGGTVVLKAYTDSIMDHYPGIEPWPEGEAIPQEVEETLAGIQKDLAGEKLEDFSEAIRDVEIFAAGTWKGDTYTEQDLDGIVDAHAKLGLVPPLKFGHSEGQRFFGQADGHPALGWISGLRRVGGKLRADISSIPQAVAGMIKNGRYRNVSSEIYWNYRDPKTGSIYPRVLKGVALLGAELPAVTGLEDLQKALLSDQGRQAKHYGHDGTTVKQYDYGEQGGSTMDDKQRIATLEGELTAEKGKVTAAEARATAAEEKAGKAELEAGVKVFSLEVDTLIKEGKVLPAEKDGLLEDFRAIGVGLRKYGDKEMTWGTRKIEELKARQKIVRFSETGEGGDEEGDPAGDKDPKSFSQAITRVMEERKCSYSEAIPIVRDKFPTIWKTYNLGESKKKEG